MDILCGEKNSPPHTQQSQMATEFTSSAVKENSESRFTSSAAIVEMTSDPPDGTTDTSAVGTHDETMSSSCPNNSNVSLGGTGSGGQAPQSKNKRKHRRGKPKIKNTKPYKKTNWKFQVPRYGRSQSGCYGGSSSNSNSAGRRMKLNRSRSLVPYNTNKFLMEEHLAEVPSALLTPSGRTRDSSFSVDSEDNYFYSLPEDEEEFLTKEFANVYEKARVERLDTLTKQQLIEECLQIEDRYSEQGAQRQQQINVQKISAEYLAKIRQLEEKIRDLTRENYELRRQLATAATTTEHPTPMDSSSEDSESDSSSSSSASSSSSESSLSEYSAPDEPKLEPNGMLIDGSLSAEEAEEVANGVAKCNGYHSAGSNTPPSSPSRPSSPTSPRLAEPSNPETIDAASRRSI